MTDEVRLIDANALKEDFMNDYNNCMMESLRGNHHDVIRTSEVIERIEDAPTIEAEPVKHGRWIYGENDDGQDGIFCSECEHFVPWFYEYYDKSKDLINDNPRCPNCCAKMDLKDGDIIND